MRTGKIICECRIPTKLDSFDMPGYIFAESWKCATFPNFTFSFLIPVKEESRFLKWVPAFLFSSKNMPPPAHLSCFSWVVWNSQFKHQASLKPMQCSQVGLGGFQTFVWFFQNLRLFSSKLVCWEEIDKRFEVFSRVSGWLPPTHDIAFIWPKKKKTNTNY